MHRKLLVGFAGPFTAADEIGLPNAFRHRTHTEGVEASPHVAARIAVLQPPGEDLVQRRTGNHTELPEPRHRPRQPPIRYSGSHAALNDNRMNVEQIRLFHDIVVRNVGFW